MHWRSTLDMRIGAQIAERIRRPLPGFDEDPGTRWWCRGVTALSDLFIDRIDGLEHVAPERDPFLLASNHGQRPEAVLVPTRLIFERGGRQIRYVADWNFMMLPIVGSLFRRNRVLVVSNKSARPRVLNRLKDRYRQPGSVLRRMEQALEKGESIGVFPEGTVNRDPEHLLPGRPSVARLSLRTGVPVVPMGIRYLGGHPDSPTRDLQRFSIQIGAPLEPGCFGPDTGESRSREEAMHLRIMEAIGRLAGKRTAQEDIRARSAARRTRGRDAVGPQQLRQGESR